MDWLQELFIGSGVAHSLILVSLTIALGITLGKVKIFGISLGATFILFVGILFGELGMALDPLVMHFCKELGLILFVYSIGLQVGPGFFSNFKKGGATLNMLAVLVVFLGALTTVVIFKVTNLPIQTLVGIMSGAITNTPGLGAAQQAYTDIMGVDDLSIAQGYAVAYPLGVIGIILTIILIRVIGRINIKEEEKRIEEANAETDLTTVPLSVEIENPALDGAKVSDLTHTLEGRKFVVSRIWKKETNEIQTVNADTKLAPGDRIFVIIDKADVEPFIMTVGHEIKMDRKQWTPNDSKYVSRKLLVSNKQISGKQLHQLNLRAIYGVNVTRVTRSGVDIVATPGLRLQYGDKLTVVGSDSALMKVTELIGNSEKHLHEPNLASIFIGIAMGILLGSVPMMIPGIPQPIKLGLAGGPLIVAILMSAYGYKYHFVSYTTISANLMLREVGLALFLACVGIGAGNGFIDTLVNQGGLTWVGYGLMITMIPILIAGLLGHFVFKIDYFTLAGMIAGSTTDPPALGYANTLSDTDASSVGYATVYPLTMFLRVVTAQLMIIFLL